nr:MAG TPA: HNH endonuclease [Caudoviricetes sp.]
MTTSRTGTAKWKRVAAQAKRNAQANGQTNCPLCHTTLNYERGYTPASAEADHIIAYSLGGTDTLDNVRIICRHCNQSRGNGKNTRKPRKRRAIRAKHTRIRTTAYSPTW